MDHINIKTGEVVYKGNKYYLTKYEVRALNRLNKGGVVTHEDLYEAIYNARVEDLFQSEKNKIALTIYRIKRKLKVRIMTRINFGYELVDRIGGTNE